MSNEDPDAPEPGWPQRLRRAREAVGLTQVEMGFKLRIGQTQYSKYERGKSVPGGARLVAIARILGVSAEWIMHGSSTPVRPEYDPPHWQEFLENYPHVDDLSERELRAIRNMWSPVFEVETWADWVMLADFARNHRRKS